MQGIFKHTGWRGFALIMLSTLGMSGAARAADKAGSLFIASAHGGGQFCVDATPGTNGQSAAVYLSSCRNDLGQRWTVTRDADGGSVFVGPAGLCLDSRVANAADGVPVQLTACHFSGSQRFRVSDDGRIQEGSGGKCLMVQPTLGSGVSDPKSVIPLMRSPDFEVSRFAERDRAPLIVTACQERALQYWKLTH